MLALYYYSAAFTCWEGHMKSKKRFYLLAALLLSTSFSNQVFAQTFTGEVARIKIQLEQTRNFQQALSQVQDLLEKEPNNAEAHMLCGKILNRLGYESLAQEEFKAADKLDPTQPQSVLALFQKKLETEGPKAANEYMTYVQARFPYDASVLIMQAMLARMNNQPLQAEFLYSLALQHHPDTPGVSTAFASLRIFQHRYKEAIDLADRDLKIKKDHPVANLTKAEALMKMGSDAEAIPYLLVSYKDSGPAKKEAADLLARAYMSTGHYGEAIEPTLVCMALCPVKDRDASIPYKRNLDAILHHRVSPSEVLNVLKVTQRQMREDERVAYMYFSAADVLDHTGHWAEAGEAFAEGLRHNPYAGRAYMRFGNVKEKLRDYKAAFELYVKAYQYNQNDREIAAHLSRLNNRKNAQDSDFAWQLKDFLAGGRVSEVPKDTSSILFAR